MGININFTGDGATVKHLNIRKQGPEDDKILAVDIKLGGEAHIGPWLRELFLPIVEDDAQFQPDLERLLWMDDEEHNCRFMAVEEFKSTRSFRECTLEYAGLQLRGEVGKISFSPVAGMLGHITFSISVSEPGAKTVSILAEMVGEYGDCALYGADLFDQQEPSVEAVDLVPDDEDPLYMKAVALVLHSGKASMSHIQRELLIGYNRAARMIERMESEGMVSPTGPDGSRLIKGRIKGNAA